jgi:hypothetical protein
MKNDPKNATSHTTKHVDTNGAKHAGSHVAEALPVVDPPAMTGTAALAGATTRPAATNGGASSTSTAPATVASTTTTTGQSAASSAASTSLLTMPFDQASRNVNSAITALAQIMALLPGLVSLPEAERKVIGGRFRDGEAQALLTVLDECAARPELVVSLADMDNGVDPTTFETSLISERIQLAMLLTPLSATLTQLASNLNDTVLYLNDLTKQPTLEAYAILKAVAKTDLSVKTAITPALDFYANIAKTAAVTRKKNAAAKLAAQTTQPAVASVTPTVAAAAQVTPAASK